MKLKSPLIDTISPQSASVASHSRKSQVTKKTSRFDCSSMARIDADGGPRLIDRSIGIRHSYYSVTRAWFSRFTANSFPVPRRRWHARIRSRQFRFPQIRLVTNRTVTNMRKIQIFKRDWLKISLWLTFSLFVCAMARNSSTESSARQRRLTLLNNGYRLLRSRLRSNQNTRVKNFTTTVSENRKFSFNLRISVAK